MVLINLYRIRENTRCNVAGFLFNLNNILQIDACYFKSYMRYSLQTVCDLLFVGSYFEKAENTLAIFVQSLNSSVFGKVYSSLTMTRQHFL